MCHINTCERCMKVKSDCFYFYSDVYERDVILCDECGQLAREMKIKGIEV